MSYNRMAAPARTGCAQCDNGWPVQLRAFCGRCRVLLPLPTCVLCGDKGWTVREMRWVRCECR